MKDMRSDTSHSRRGTVGAKRPDFLRTLFKTDALPPPQPARGGVMVSAGMSEGADISGTVSTALREGNAVT